MTSSSNRSAQFAKIHKVLKKYYHVTSSGSDRTVMEHLLFACCLEDAHRNAAEEAFAALKHTFFDWNEVRVTSISELSEVMACLPDPRAAANRVKRVLHSVFEATFSFDLEDRKKKNLGPTEKWLQELDGTTRFVVAYVVQMALGGHAIPVDSGSLAVLRVLNLITDKDVAEGVVPGLERAVAKSKGIEFGMLLHELGADYAANPYSPMIREILTQIDPECVSRLPKRRAPRKPTVTEERVSEEGKTPQKATAAPAPQKPGKAAAPGRQKKPAAQAEPVAEPPKKPATSKQTEQKPAADKTPARVAAKKKSISEGLAKRKPR